MSEDNPENQQQQPGQTAQSGQTTKPIEPANGGAGATVAGDQQQQPGQTAQSGQTTKPVEPANGGAGATVAGGGGGKKLGMGQIVKWAAGAAIGGVGIYIVYILFNGLSTKDSIVRELGNPDLARGVITFIFAIGTIGIAILLTLGALIGDHTQEEFTKAKEVLTVLIGVFGTILGFYFGTATGGGAQKLDVAEIQVTDKQIMTHVAGGTRPYRYSITATEKGFTPVTDQVSKDGWIIQQPPAIPKTGSITVDVTDSHDLKGSRERKLSAETPAASPTPTPSASGTTTQSSPQQ